MPHTTPSIDQFVSAPQYQLDQWRYALDATTRQLAQQESRRRLALLLQR